VVNLAVSDLPGGRLTELPGGQAGGWGSGAAPAFGLFGFFGNLKDQPLATREYRVAQGAMIDDNPLPRQTAKTVLA
jgi:hypothetical protein